MSSLMEGQVRSVTVPHNRRDIDHLERSAKDLSKEDIMNMFQKKFHYKKQEDNDHCLLPPVTECMQEYYQISSLQELKNRLNTVKSKLNDYFIEDWSAHTRRMDPSSEISWRLKNKTKAEFVTVAWCKFFECLHNYPLVQGPELNTLHLCEAPGAFIAALNHYLYSKYDRKEVKWNWLSTTLNPYFEGNPLNKMIIDDRFILYTLDRWIFHRDFTGNIMSAANIEDMQKECVLRLDDNVTLITADGSIDCVEQPDFQEEFVSMLHFSEITAALSILADGGSFVLKMFTLFEATSVSKMFLLHCVFENVHVYKPVTSKRGNSEVYVICLKYKKNTKYLAEILGLMKSKLSEGGNVMPLFSKAQIPKQFLMQHEICVRLFMNLQIKAIESNITSYELKTPHDVRRMHYIRTQVSNEFYKMYNVTPLPEELTILYQCHGVIQYNVKSGIYRGSYSERKMMEKIALEEQIFLLRTHFNELEKSFCYNENSVLLLEDAKRTNKNLLKIYKGHAYAMLNSSLFVSVHILLLHHKLRDIFKVDPLWQGEPKCTLDDVFDINFDHNICSDYSRIQMNFFVSVLTAIIEKKPHQVTFTNFPFLSHYSVSILRYLTSTTFQKQKISVESDFKITLQRFPDQSNDLDNTSTIISLRDLIANDENILCVTAISELHRNEFSRALTDYNNLLLLNKCKLMLNN